MVLTFYYDLLSQPCRSVFMFMELNKIQFQAHPVLLNKGEHLTEAFKKKNPYSTIPYIVDEDDGFNLSESAAIMYFLAMKYNVTSQWFGKNVKDQARVAEYTHWHHSAVRKSCLDTFLPVFTSKDVQDGFPKQPFDEACHNRGKEQLEKALKHLGEYYLQDKAFLCTNYMTVADLLCFNEMEQLKIVGLEQLYMKNVKVAKWIEKMKTELKKVMPKAMERREMFRKNYQAAK